MCERDDLAPDVFVSLVNLSTIRRESLLVAVCDDVATPDTSGQLDHVARVCGELLDRPILARTERYWGRSVLNDFRQSMQDYWPQVAHALRAGADDATIESLPGRWRPATPE